jgi:signal peptidase I
MRSYLKFLLWTGGIVAVIGLVLYYGLFDVWTVPSDDPQMNVSIQPTLLDGDVVLISRHGVPGWGNLVRCLDPENPGRYVVGRIVGQPGDDLELRGESLSVNRRAMTTVGACDPTRATLKNPATQEDVELQCSRREFAGLTLEFYRAAQPPYEKDLDVKVEPNRIYLLSDNVHLHLDSRDFGSINLATCQHIVYRLWGTTGAGDSKRRFTVIW